jgi:hypothetical protein
MKTLKKIGFWIVSYTVRLALFGTILTAVAVAIIGKNSYVKDVLNETKSYDRFVPAVIEANKAAPQGSNSLNYDDQNIVKIFTESFPADDLKSKTEHVIDEVYAWLNGEQPQLKFSADFSPNKQLLADKLSAYAFTRLAKLPPCKSLPETINPLTIECKPVGFDLKEVQESYRQQLLASDSFLSKTILTEEDLPKNTAGKTLPDQYAFAPTAFRWLLRAPYILGVLTLVFSVAYVWLSPKKRKGVAGLGSILMSSGISLAIFPILFDIVIPRFTDSFQVQSGTQGTQAIFSDIISSITAHFVSLFITIGIQLFVAGLCVYLIERVTRNEAAKYKTVEKKSGVVSSNQKPEPTPKSLRGKLAHDNIPVQTSDLPTRLSPDKIASNKKYAKLSKKKRM